MGLSRRDFLRLTSLVAGAAGVSACSPAYAVLAGQEKVEAGWPLPVEPAFRALLRLTFGPTRQERQLVHEMGLGAWIETQLEPKDVPDGRAAWLVRRHDAIGLEADALESWDRPQVIEQLRAATLLRQLYSRRQVYERMVEFWTDHFNISVAKGDCWFLKLVDDREVIRKHAMGNFRELLLASAHSPAMLVYLDNQANHKDAPNENYAREVMELHTLGVDGGYRQTDVMELARCLTGWTVKDHFWRGQFKFDPGIHAAGAKRVLGLKIEPAGETEAQRVLEHLATHPSTAGHLAFKLVRRFVTDHPDRDAPELVARLRHTFLSTRGDITAMLRVLLLDGLAQRAPDLPPKFKRPTDYVVSSLRLLGSTSDASEGLQNHLAEMGQPPFEWPTPDGPPDTASAWMSSLLPRWNFALEMARNRIAGVHTDFTALVEASGEAGLPGQIETFSQLLLGGGLDPAASRELEEILEGPELDPHTDVPSLLTAGLLASPAFQWR